MSSHPYVTQQNTPLADDTTLMSTTDLQSYITHANDTFVQVSGFTLQELQGQPHNMVRHPDMPKAAFADMWFTLKKGEPWSGIVKNRRKNGDHYWVRANAVPMVREGKISGYMSIRTRATDEEIAAVEPLYKALNAGRTSKRIHKGLVVRKGWLGKLPSLPLRWRARGVMTLMFILLAVMLWFVAAPVVTYILCALVVLLASACFEWQIVRPIENVARQALKVATGERNSVEHLNRSDELGLTLRAVGQLGLMCRWLINDVSSQVSSVRNGSETLAKGTDELNEHTQQTVDNVQQTVATMNQMAASVKQNSATASAADKLSITASNAAVQGGEAMTTVIKTMDDIADSTQRIGTITSLINDIAFAANDIRKLIDASADKVQSGSQQVHAAGRTMEDIVAQVKNVTQLIAQISHSTLEQADGLSSLTRAVDELNLITQKNAELVEESAQVSAMVKHRASRLEDAVTVLH
ncbi:PAS domain-containing protein [Escherichia coli]|nr:PAS domain-containing protein [Escherichia coli]